MFSLTGALDIFSFCVVYVFVCLSLRIDGSVQYSISLYALLRIKGSAQKLPSRDVMGPLCITIINLPQLGDFCSFSPAPALGYHGCLSIKLTAVNVGTL